VTLSTIDVPHIRTNRDAILYPIPIFATECWSEITNGWIVVTVETECSNGSIVYVGDKEKPVYTLVLSVRQARIDRDLRKNPCQTQTQTACVCVCVSSHSNTITSQTYEPLVLHNLIVHIISRHRKKKGDEIHNNRLHSGCFEFEYFIHLIIRSHYLVDTTHLYSLLSQCSIRSFPNVGRLSL
jgi:hypothetical protein